MVRAALTIFSKDLRLRVRDRSVFVFAFVVPFGLTVVLSFVFPDSEDFHLTAAVVDLDRSEVSRGFTNEVVPVLVDAGVVELHPASDEVSVRSAMEHGDLSAAWIFPDGFGAAVTSGQPANMRVLVNPDRVLSGEVARGIAEGYTRRLEQAGLAVATAVFATDGDLDASQLQALATGAVAADPPIRLGNLVAAERQLDAVSYLAAGMAVFFVFFIVQYGVSGLLEEQQQGTLPRLMAAPIPIAAVHVGKGLGAFVLGIVSMTVLAVGSSLVLGAEWGPTAGIALLIVAAVVAALGVMALVGSFAKTAEQAGNLQSVVAVVLGLIGGVFFPVGGGLLGQLSLASPHGWFLRGLADLVGTGQWTAALPAVGALVAFGVVLAVPGMIRLRRVSW